MGDCATDATIGTSVRFGRTLVVTVLGDLLDQPVEAVVLAANRRGQMGAGVAGAVRVAGGAQIEREAMERAPLPLGGAIATTSGALSERGITTIVHAIVSERLAAPSAIEVIRRSTEAVFQLVDRLRLHSIAIPPIGGGQGPDHLPAGIAAEAIVGETVAYLRRTSSRLDRIVFVSRHDDEVLAFAKAVADGRARSWKGPP